MRQFLIGICGITVNIFFRIGLDHGVCHIIGDQQRNAIGNSKATLGCIRMISNAGLPHRYGATVAGSSNGIIQVDIGSTCLLKDIQRATRLLKDRPHGIIAGHSICVVCCLRHNAVVSAVPAGKFIALVCSCGKRDSCRILFYCRLRSRFAVHQIATVGIIGKGNCIFLGACGQLNIGEGDLQRRRRRLTSCRFHIRYKSLSGCITVGPC